MCLRVSADLLRPLGPLSPVCSSADDMPGSFEGFESDDESAERFAAVLTLTLALAQTPRFSIS
jgi:hypothetical protein